jgi:hypothetical protein
MGNEYRHTLKVHLDVITLPTTMNKLYKEYSELGYQMHGKYPGSFSYKLEDGSVILVFWKDGIIYEDVAVFPHHKINFDLFCFAYSSDLDLAFMGTYEEFSS